jgi:hypothetical protein
MTYLDTAILNLIEWICRRFQAWTGKTNVWLAFQLTNLSVVVYFVWVGVLYWLSGDLVLRMFVAIFCASVFFVLTRTLFRSSIEIAEAEAYHRVAKGPAESPPRSRRTTAHRIPDTDDLPVLSTVAGLYHAARPFRAADRSADCADRRSCSTCSRQIRCRRPRRNCASGGEA